MVAGENSKKLYKNKIDKLKEYNIKIDGTVSVSSIITILKDKDMSQSTIKTYLCAILWDIRRNNDKDKEEFINSLSESISQINTEIQNFNNKNQSTDRQKEIFVDWNSILKMYNELKIICNESKRSYEDYLLVSLYVLFPPRRILDYSEMHIVKQINDNMIDTTEKSTYDKNNYYVYGKKLFIFNNFKTKGRLINENEGVYRRQVFDVPDDLAKIIEKYVDDYNIIGSLFGISDKNMIGRLTKISKKYLGKLVSANVYRHAFITHQRKTGNLNTKQNVINLSQKMAHSIDMQLEYYKEDL